VASGITADVLNTPGTGLEMVALARYATAPSVRESLFEPHGMGVLWVVAFTGSEFQLRSKALLMLLSVEPAPETWRSKSGDGRSEISADTFTTVGPDDSSKSIAIRDGPTPKSPVQLR